MGAIAAAGQACTALRENNRKGWSVGPWTAREGLREWKERARAEKAAATLAAKGCRVPGLAVGAGRRGRSQDWEGGSGK